MPQAFGVFTFLGGGERGSTPECGGLSRPGCGLLPIIDAVRQKPRVGAISASGWPLPPCARQVPPPCFCLPKEFPLPFDFKSLRGRNRFYLKAWGHPTPEGIFDFASAAIVELSKLREGFDVVSDVSGLSSLSCDCMPQVDRLTAFLADNHVGRVVRICGPLPDIILKLERQARARGYAAHLATSVEEAEALLDERH